MSKFKGTPGPWHCVEYGGFMEIQAGEYYGDQKLLDLEHCNEAKENGVLAASAPELLEACIEAVKLSENRMTTEGTPVRSLECQMVYDQMVLAINKALGKEIESHA